MRLKLEGHPTPSKIVERLRTASRADSHDRSLGVGADEAHRQVIEATSGPMVAALVRTGIVRNVNQMSGHNVRAAGPVRWQDSKPLLGIGWKRVEPEMVFSAKLRCRANV